MIFEQAYVFIDGLEDSPVICGVVTLDPVRRYGEFRYGKSYLARPDAFALDPLNLPLSDELFTTSGGKGLFGVLTDAGADAWGQRVILSLHKTKPANALQFLLAGSGMGVGASGRFGSVENLLSHASRFGLKTVKARKLISQVQDLVSEWPSYFARLGVGEGDIERLHGIIPRID